MQGMSSSLPSPGSIRVTQSPGGTSSFTLAWPYPTPALSRSPDIRRFNSPQVKARQTLRVVETAGSPRRFCVKVANPPGGKSTMTIS